MVGEAIGKSIESLFAVATVGVVAILFCLFIGVKTIFFPKKKEIVSKTRLIPEIRLKTDGKKVDTFYVYRKEK